MIRFAQPWYLLALAVIPLVQFLRMKGWGKPAAVLYPEVSSVRAAFKGGRRPGSGWREILRLVAIALLILAVARPQLLQSVRNLSAVGLDVVLDLDISGSMSARDFEPLTRLQAAKAVLREFVAKEQCNRLGLIAFAARAYTVCPLTLDYHVLLMLLDHLDIGMTTDGTAIGMAIAAALNRLKYSEAPAKVIILLTDGRNNAGALDPLTAAEMAAALKIRIYTIGMGQPGGAPIVVKDSRHGETMLLNSDGSIHMEAVDEDTLRRISEKTGGRFFRATDKDKLKAIYSEIRQMENQRLYSKGFESNREIGHFFIALALLLFVGEIALAQTRENRLP
jgi:Ca-activated chloride channel family protein